MKPDADRGNAPRSALSTSRTSWWFARCLRAPCERPLRTDRASGDVSGSTVGVSPPSRGPAARNLPSGMLRVALGKSQEAAEEVGPRRGHKPMEGTSDSPLARVSNATDPFAEKRLEVEDLA